MAFNRQVTILLFTYFLLTTCWCSPPSRSKRQKRGLVKMMMHIMWDPVRLIRYWYAYDVGWEIAKSWRKIIPTILLLPYTQKYPHSHGLSKYVNPTVGIRDYNKNKIKSKLPSVPPNYLESNRYISQVAIPPGFVYPLPLSRQSNVAHNVEHKYQTSSSSHLKHKKMPFIVVHHVPFEDTNADSEDNKEYSFANYFMTDDTSREETPVFENTMHFPGRIKHSNANDDISSSSSHTDISSSQDYKHYVYPPGDKVQNHFHFVPNVDASEKDEHGQHASPIVHPGQEVHIVLHPIPVRDFNSDFSKQSLDGHAMQFLPQELRFNGSYGKDFRIPPLIIKTVSLSSAETGDSEEEHPMDILRDSNGNIHNLNNSDSSIVEQVETATSDKVKPRVIWFTQKNPNMKNQNEQREKEVHSEESKKRVVSVHNNSKQNYKSNKNNSSHFNPKRHNINMDRLREKLKHGTPVLIPFDKDTHSAEVVTKQKLENPVTFPQTSKEHLDEDYRTEEQSPNVKSLESSSVHEDSTEINNSSESSGERNSTQRLILFLKKRKHT